MPRSMPSDFEDYKIKKVVDLSREDIEKYREAFQITDQVKKDIHKIILSLFSELRIDEINIWRELRAKYNLPSDALLRIVWTTGSLIVYENSNPERENSKS